MQNIIILISSFLIVALGQPAKVPLLCPLASAIGYGLFFWVCSKCSKKWSRLLLAFIWFFLVHSVQLSWMLSIKYQGYYIVFVYVLIVALLALQFLCITYALFYANSAKIPRILFTSALATLLEWSRLFFFSGFGFNFSGVALSFHTCSLQLASVFGVLGLSFFVWYANISFYAWLNRSTYKNLLIFLFVAFIPYGFGFLSINVKRANEEQKDFMNVLLVQPGFCPSQKMYMKNFASEFVTVDKQWQSIISHILPYKDRDVDLIVLPESVVPYGFKRCVYPLLIVQSVLDLSWPGIHHFYPEFKAPYAVNVENKWMVSNAFILQTIANVMQSEVVAGLDDFDLNNDQYYNAAFCFKPFSDHCQRYEKQVLLPLAETLPWKFLKKYTKYYGISEFFTAGDSSKVIGSMDLGVHVCIEETIPEIVRGFKLNGAKILISLSNDGWYPNTILPWQHFYHGRLRAVENGLPLLRACSTGVTTAIDPFGRFDLTLQPEGRSTIAESGACLKKINLMRRKTLYSFWGDSAIIIFCLMAILFSTIYSYKIISNK